jgi:hypothetical protein
MKRLHYLVHCDEGNVYKVNRHLCNKKDVVDVGVQLYHKMNSELAGRAVLSQKIDEREFNSFSLVMRKKDIGSAKKKIRSFINQFIKEFDVAGDGDEVYQLNV